MNPLHGLLQGSGYKKVAGTKGGEWHGACPFCGGKDRFRIQPHAGICGYFGCRRCERHGSAYDYVMETEGIGFREAKMRVDNGSTEMRIPKPVDTISYQAAWWQETLNLVAERAESQANGAVLGKLSTRGISFATMRKARIGIVPTTFTFKGLYFPAGILIPTFADGKVVACKIRTDDGKYIHIKGSNGRAIYGGLPQWRERVRYDRITLIVESELDALTLLSVIERAQKFDEESADLYRLSAVVPIALGSAQCRPHSADMTELKAKSKHIICALDADDAGDQAYGFWQDCCNATRARPIDNDPGDTWIRGGDQAIKDWLKPFLHGKPATAKSNSQLALDNSYNSHYNSY